MRTLGILSVAGMALLGACSHGADARPDDALKNDLALAAQVQPYQAQQVTSASEQLSAPGMANQYNAAPRRPVAAAPVYRSRARHAASRGSASAGSSGDYYPSAPQEPIRNTRRDAAIGAGAGAIIGAVTSSDKIKGGIIGAAAGGILGGIIGHTVDVQHP